MKLLFIAPRSSYWKSQFIYCEPMGLSYIAAAAQEKGHEIKLFQQLTPNNPSDAFLVEEARNFKPDVIAVSVLSDNYSISKDLVRRLRDVSAALVVYGGKHASIHPEIVSEEEIDVVVIGEGEETFCEVLDQYDGTVESIKSIDGVAYDDHELKINPVRKRIENLDAIPFPYRDGLPMDRYRMVNFFAIPASRQRMASCVSSRGCVFDCIFCPTPKLSNRRWIARFSGNIVAEIEELLDRFNINYLLFHDEDVLLNREKALSLCEEMIAKGFPRKLKWGCETNISNIDDELLDILARSGNVFLSFGIESGSEESLERMRKKMDLAKVKESLIKVRRRLIQTNANIIIGFPWEDREKILKGFEVIKSMPVDTLAINILNPVQGTELWDMAVDEGLIVDSDFHNWHHKRAVMNTRHLEAAEVDRLYRLINKRYYFRIRYVLQLLWLALRRPVYCWSMIEIFLFSLRTRIKEL